MAPLHPKTPSSDSPPVVPPRPAERPWPQAQNRKMPLFQGPVPPPLLHPHQAPLPPQFEASRQDQLNMHPQFKEALNWYRDHLQEGDIQLSSHGRLTDIQKLLKDDVNPGPGVDSHSWRPVMALGKGTYGSVVLWERDTGNCDHPVEHVACKDAKFDNFYRDYCHEGHLIRRLNVAGCPNVIKIHEWAPLPGKDFNRMILEYCPMGDLSGLSKWYKKNQLVFPEAFLWHVFRSVATAICYWARGTTGDEPVRGWQEIIHRDLKPANILLTEPTQPSFYPTLKVSDFGLAYSVPTDTMSVRQFKRSYWSAGTPFYCPPEVDAQIRSDPDQAPDPIASARSDIFSLGCIIMKFIWFAQDKYDQREWRQLDFTQDWAYKWFPYSRPLIELTLQCLNLDARARPDPLDLYKTTTHYAFQSQNPVQQGMQQALEQRQTSIYYGMVLTPSQRTWFRESAKFNTRVRHETDWFHLNAHQLQALQRTRHNGPAAARFPPDTVALLSGLEGYVPLADLVAQHDGFVQDAFLEELPIFDERGRRQKRADGSLFLRYVVAQERLVVPDFDRDWRRTKKIRELVQYHEAKEAIRERRHEERKQRLRAEAAAAAEIPELAPPVAPAAKQADQQLPTNPYPHSPVPLTPPPRQRMNPRLGIPSVLVPPRPTHRTGLLPRKTGFLPKPQQQRNTGRTADVEHLDLSSPVAQ